MKTLAVLSALATIAIAAPAVENYTDGTRLSPKDFTITQQREKKSTPLETHSIPVHAEEHTSEHILNKVESSNTDARTFSHFKKPIMVKKKIGYHVYRNSEEEQSSADSQENCRKQMKEKLCDDNNLTDKVKNASINQHEKISESEMEHSLKIAKQAVHTFEKDLQKMEHDCGVNNKHRHTTFGSDTELHQDIERAREALEHIQRKFKNLDSVTPTGDENTSKFHTKAVKSDEERMIQWKESGDFHKNAEIARNLEDNFKSIDAKEESKDLMLNRFNYANKDFKSTIEDVDAPPRLNNKFEDGVTSIVEDKDRKMEIHSDSLIKDAEESDVGQQKEIKLSGTEHHATEQIKMSEEKDNHEFRKHNKDTKDRAMQNTDTKLTLEELKGNDLNVLDKHARNHADNTEMLISGDHSSAPDNHARTKQETELQKAHTSTHANDQAMHESRHVDTVSSTNSKINIHAEEAKETHEELTTRNDNNKEHLDNIEHRTALPKHTEFINHSQKQLRNEDNIKDTLQHMDLQRSTKLQAIPKKDKKTEDEINMDTRSSISSSSMTVAKLDTEKDNEKPHFKNDIDNHANNDVAHLRATSDLHKELLNNMDFIEDHIALHQTSQTDKSHMMKNEKSELHERLNVPRLHPNSEHLKNMMQFSDNPHHVTPHLKMASMFNNEEPNFNVQFNSPQDFVEQTNVQELMPFRNTDTLHDNTGLDKRLNTMRDTDNSPTELHDPLKVHWAHSENMRMDGSSQHFNIEKLNPSRGNSINGQQLSLNEQIRAQQHWAQAKNINAHQLSPLNSGFEHLHSQGPFVSRNNGHNLMMHGKSNVDSTVQPSAFAQMRGGPKMALEYTDHNQWAHNHGEFRSSYGPGLTPYGSGGGPSSGSALGVFPNANVGNCAVPILLSCSPSVVTGRLTKTESGYSAPAYRSEDANFVKKRGADIDDVTQGLKHTPLGYRPNVILEKHNNTV